jgi:hypothetical protein
MGCNKSGTADVWVYVLLWDPAAALTCSTSGMGKI